jgi:hypothetical protein
MILNSKSAAIVFSPIAQLLVSRRLESHSSHVGCASFPLSGQGLFLPPTHACRAGVRKSWVVLYFCQFNHFLLSFLRAMRAKTRVALCIVCVSFTVRPI